MLLLILVKTYIEKRMLSSKTQNKKGNWVVTINVNDQSNTPTFILEVFKNGSAFLSINANDRQPISYDGYISNLNAK
ncbi:protein of unknown function [Soonwooa buanensis]|uniref:Uncharacterized protein n=1 Tax=Soonwooa buanensis TaxID=619805 RepID=A0A1T5FVQ1_9FLAO|nr:DUF4251 domain-containing protein [Soonwooa buanensis]SKC00167.1 protein of unknown function [Soonwooa buanensis]